jgi:hypothetical protein
MATPLLGSEAITRHRPNKNPARKHLQARHMLTFVLPIFHTFVTSIVSFLAIPGRSPFRRRAALTRRARYVREDSERKNKWVIMRKEGNKSGGDEKRKGWKQETHRDKEDRGHYSRNKIVGGL